MMSTDHSFGRLLDMGLATVKARQNQTIEAVVKGFAEFMKREGTHDRRGDLAGAEAVNSWRLRGVLPNPSYRYEVAELVVAFCTDKGLVNRWWAESILDAVAHPRRQSILDAYFPTTSSNVITPARSLIEGLSSESDDTQLRKLIEGSSEFWAWGTTFQGHVSLLKQLLEQALARETKLRFLLIEPQSSAVEMAAFRANFNSSQQSNATLEANLRQIYELIPPSRPQMLELRVVNYLGPYTMYVFDRYRKSGQMLLHLSSFHGKYAWDRPTISLSRSSNTDWFEYFTHQFQRVWDVAQQFTPQLMQKPSSPAGFATHP